MDIVSNAGLEDALASKLKELLGSIPWLHDWRIRRVGGKSDPGYDIEAFLPLPSGKTTLAVECKKELRPSTFHAWALQNSSRLGHPKAVVPVLAMPYVSPRMSELCVEHGWGWFDLAGNCHIDVPNTIYLDRRGNESSYSPSRPPANLSTREAARVIRALLAPENFCRRWTQRSLETHFGSSDPRLPEPSLGLVNKVVKHLRDEAFIDASPDGFFVREPEKLLMAWRDVYRFDRHERRNYFTLMQGRQLRDALAQLGLDSGGFAAYAAFSAADGQAPHVRQPKTWIYLDAEYTKRLEESAEAKRVDTGDNLIVLIPDDPGVFYVADRGTVGEHRLASTNPVQTYVDLYHCGGRGEEAADALLEQNLRPHWGRSKSHER
jgi:transcriptional regulator with AbiEi antitoxin domain of type IV toxin-antitoxin system